MLTTILGNLGSGKTVLMVIIAFFQNRKIVTNFSLSFDNIIDKQFDIEEFELNKFLRAEYEDCLILLDEAYNYFESRISGSELNLLSTYILFQSRKKNVELYITAQLFSSIDKRFRELSDNIIIANRIGMNFAYIIIDSNKKQYLKVFTYEKVALFFQFYNTNEVITTTNQKLLFDIQQPDVKLDTIQNYANEIKEYYNTQQIENVTKNLIDLYIKTHSEIPKFIANDIFTVIRLERKLNKIENPKKSKKSKTNE